MADEQNEDLEAEEASKKSRKKKEAISPEKKAALMSANELIRIRNSFYRDNYRRLTLLLILFLLAIVFLTYLIYYEYTHRPAPRYFATNIQGEVIELKPMYQAGLSNDYILAWSKRAIEAAWGFDYINWQKQLEMAQDIYFTPKGGFDFVLALHKSKNLETVKQQKYIVTAKSGDAVIKSQGMYKSGPMKNRYAWIINLPIKVTFHRPPNTQISAAFDMTMEIVRSSALIDKKAKFIDSAQGIGINRIIGLEAG